MRDLSVALVDEKSLVKDAAGNPEAFAKVYTFYFKPVFNFVRYRVSDLSTAEDLTAAIFEKVLKGLRGFRLTTVPFSVWLFKIARNVINDHYRQAGRNRCQPMESFSEKATEEIGPSEQFLLDETKAELLAGIRKLPNREQEILALKFAARLTNREIARSLGLSESHVGVILYRTVQQLRAELSGGKSHA